MNQISYDPLDFIDQFAGCPTSYAMAHAAARRERDRVLRATRKAGSRAYGWTLPNQLKKYSGLGVEDGRIRNVYYITVEA